MLYVTKKFVKISLHWEFLLVSQLLQFSSIEFAVSYPLNMTTSPGIAVPPPEILKFMRTFGYLEPNPSDSEALYHEVAIMDAVRNIQKFGALNQTGILDNQTLKLMTSPRCGVQDILSPAERHRLTKRYIIGARSWRKRKLTYFIANWSPKVGEEKAIRDMRRAFDIWAKYSNLKFKRVYDPSADIIIAFGAKYHGDGYPFDGPGNILAHAFYPYEMQTYGGDIHFDDDEDWKENAASLSEGVDFLSVAVHELGHSLGLAHSPVYSSIMFPYYKGAGVQNLDFDDILAMYELYINVDLEDDEDSNDNDLGWDSVEKTTNIPQVASTSTTRPAVSTSPTYDGDFETVDDHNKRKSEQIPTTTTSPVSAEITDIPNICLGSFDAVTVFRGAPFIFKGKYVWQLSNQYRTMPGYPITISQLFSFLPNDVEKIDAAYQRTADEIVFFSGRRYWIYDGSNLIDNTPRTIADLGIPESIANIDAAMFWPKNQRTYLFAGDQFWRFVKETHTLEHGYPKNVTRWSGIPSNIDAATTMPNGKTYFFKDNMYWLYNNKYIRPHRGYPRKASNAWFGCPLA